MKKEGASTFLQNVEVLQQKFLKELRQLFDGILVGNDGDFRTAIRILIRAGFSQSEIAMAAEVAQPTISRWCTSGPLPPRRNRITIIAQLKQLLDNRITQNSVQYREKAL